MLSLNVRNDKAIASQSKGFKQTNGSVKKRLVQVRRVKSDEKTTKTRRDIGRGWGQADAR